MGFYVNRSGALEYLTADSLTGAVHCFSTRFGGVSREHLASLNLGTHRGDVPERVLENYRILASAVGFRPEDTVFTRQLHTDIVAHVGTAHRGDGLLRPVEDARDALITDEPGVVLTIFSADCTPVLLYDPVRRAIGAAHAGWRGTAADIAGKTARAMQRVFGCRPADIRAAIGPCISQCCFETDGDVPEAMVAAYGPAAEAAIRPQRDKFYVNLKLLNEISLRAAGLEQVEVSGDCTACQTDRFWSHRRVGNRRGSLAAMIMLREEGGA